MRYAFFALMASSRFALAAPSPQAGGGGSLTCVDDTHFMLGGKTFTVATGTKCVASNGGGAIQALDAPVVAAESGATQSSAIPPAVVVISSSTSSSAGGGSGPGATNPASSGVTIPIPTQGTPAKGESSQASSGVITPGTLGQIVAQMPLGATPPSGAAKCPANKPATVTAAAPAPLSTSSNKDGKRYVAYWSVWHGTGPGLLPTAEQLKGVTHLVLAFWDPQTINQYIQSPATIWDITTTTKLKAIRKDMKVMLGAGGWALDEFFRFNATDENRDGLAATFADFIYMYDLDGIDIDWEYPVFNGASYKTTRPKSDCDKDNNVLLMQSIRNALENLKKKSNKKEYILSLAVPAIKGDMELAYDKAAATEINKVVDFWNLMTYDAMNRRSTKTGHQAGKQVIESVVANYAAVGVDKKKMNIGFPMYGKFFMLNMTTTACPAAVGCSVPEGAFEGKQGEDLGLSGSLVFNNNLNTADNMGAIIYGVISGAGGTAASVWTSIQARGVRDDTAMATTAYDDKSKIWYTWLSPKDMQDSCQATIGDVGGIMVWSIDQDSGAAAGGEHFKALQSCISAK